MDLNEELDRLEHSITLARLALADEHEAALKHELQILTVESLRVYVEVMSW